MKLVIPEALLVEPSVYVVVPWLWSWGSDEVSLDVSPKVSVGPDSVSATFPGMDARSQADLKGVKTASSVLGESACPGRIYRRGSVGLSHLARSL